MLPNLQRQQLQLLQLTSCGLVGTNHTNAAELIKDDPIASKDKSPAPASIRIAYHMYRLKPMSLVNIGIADVCGNINIYNWEFQKIICMHRHLSAGLVALYLES